MFGISLQYIQTGIVSEFTATGKFIWENGEILEEEKVD